MAVLGACSNDSPDMKRKASEEADTPDSKHRSKKARTESFNEIKVQRTQCEHLTCLI
jgi:histone acetyltransferase